MIDTYVSFSGGADSTALAIYLQEQGHEIELVFADTGAELLETYHHVPIVADALDVPLTVVSHGTMFQWLVSFGYHLPSMYRRWCTRLLKRFPLDAHQKDMAVGICADEAHRMPDGNRPLVDAGITHKDAIELCKKHELLNPAYKWRSSVSCFCCPFQRINDWRHLAQEHPYLFALAERWEMFSIDHNKTPFTWIYGKRLTDLRMATENQLEMFPEPRDQACLICRW